MEVHLYLLLFLSTLGYSNPRQAVNPINGVGILGAIVNNTTRVGKEGLVAIQMAMEDFCNIQNQACSAFKFMSSQGEPSQAALAVRQLIQNERDVQVIVGPRSWEETNSVVSEVFSHQKNIPILSLSDSNPSWATRRWPFLYQASPSKNRQMKAIAAVVESCRWRWVNVIYEEVDSYNSANGVIPHLHHALQEVGAQISNLIALSPFAADASLSSSDSELSEGLLKLKGQQCRVFVVHVSLSLALRLFRAATEMKMMGKGYVWIITDTVTNHIHCLNSSSFSAMQGVIGVKSYYDESNQGKIKYQDFHERFEEKFGSRYPQEKSYEPGSLAVEAYDAAWTVALAMEKGKVNVENLYATKYNGISGEIEFDDEGRLVPVNLFQIINVYGKSHKELGFWSDGGIGFFDASMKKGSMDIFGRIFWPGGLHSVPRGWKIPSVTDPLKIVLWLCPTSFGD